mgnify:FL=1
MRVMYWLKPIQSRRSTAHRAQRFLCTVLATIGDRRVEEALTWVLRVSDRILSEICPPRNVLRYLDRASLPTDVSAYHSAIISPSHQTVGAQLSRSWGGKEEGIPNASKVTLLKPRTANRRDTRLNKPSPLCTHHPNPPSQWFPLRCNSGCSPIPLH